MLQMTIQLTQQWDCGSTNPFQSSGTWTPQAGWMTGGGDGGEARGRGETGRRGVGGAVGGGGRNTCWVTENNGYHEEALKGTRAGTESKACAR